MIGPFVLGWIAGTIAVPLCFLFGFEAVTKLAHLSNKLFIWFYALVHGKKVATRAFNKRYTTSILGSLAMSSIDENGMGRTPRASAEGERLGMPRLFTICQSMWVRPDYIESGGIVHVVGTLRDSRIVFSDTSLTVYDILSSRNVDGHVRVITEEQLAGRMSLDALAARAVTLNVRRVAAGNTSSSRDLHRHVLLVTRRDGRPLFAAENAEETDELNITQSVCTESVSTMRLHGMRKRNKKNYVTPTQGMTWDDFAPSMDDRKCLALRFHLARDLERWQSLLEGHNESLQWNSYVQRITTPDTFNIFLSRVLFQSLRTTALGNLVRKKIQHLLNRVRIEKFPREIEGHIFIDECVIGDQVPIFSNVTTPIISAQGEMNFDMDILYRGGCTFCFRCHLTYRGIRIPHVVFSVKIVHISGRVRLSISPPPSKKFWLGVLKKPEINLEVHQSLECERGLLHRILTSLPDLSAIATNAVKMYIYSDLALPSMDDFSLPSVTKTPPSSPLARKIWNTHFDRRGAAANHKHKGSLVEHDSTPGSSQKISKNCRLNVQEKGEDGSPPKAAPISTLSEKEGRDFSKLAHNEDCVTPSVMMDELFMTGTSSSEMMKPLLLDGDSASLQRAPLGPAVLSVTQESARSCSSEEGRRERLKKRVRKIMRPAIRIITGCQETLFPERKTSASDNNNKIKIKTT